MDDATLATINVDQLNQAVSNIISANQQQQAAAAVCASIPVSAGTFLPAQQGLTLASLPQLSSINLGCLPQIVSLPQISDSNQGVVQPRTITESQNITLAAANQLSNDNHQLQQQLTALTIPLSRLIEAKDLQAAQLMLQNQQINTDQVLQRSVPTPQQGQTVVQQPGQTVVQQQAQLGIQQPGQTIIQTADLPILTARTLQQAIQQFGSVGNFFSNNQAIAGPVIDNTGNTVYTILSAGNTVGTTVDIQVQPQGQGLQTTAPLVVLPSTTTTTSKTPISCNAVPSISACAKYLQDILPVCGIVQDVVINKVEDQQLKETAVQDQSTQGSENGMPSLSVLEMILKSSESEANSQLGQAIKTIKNEVRIEGIFCVDCNANYIEVCPNHGKDYKIICDSPMLSRARMSVPHELTLKPSSINENTTGVFARENLEKRVRFGPLEGAMVELDSEEDKSDVSFWRIFEEERCVKILDGYKEEVANWMPFVQIARNSKEQNLIAYQQNKEIFFASTKPIEAGTELLLWYAHDYASLIDVSPDVDEMSKCKICRRQFPNIAQVMKHQKYSHPDMSLRKWKCQFCDKAFQGSGKLQIHLLTHMGVKPHKCDYCDKRFTDLSNLKVHILRHTGEKKFNCEVCDKSFLQKAHLNSHKVTHTKEKPFSCECCGVRFGRNSDRKAHERKHMRDKAFTCIQCSKSFHTLHSFKRHMKTHTGQRDHPCDSCSKAFITKYHLERHKKICKGPVTVAKDDEIPKKRRKRAKISDIS